LDLLFKHNNVLLLLCERVDGREPHAVSAYLRTCETHALKEGVENLHRAASTHAAALHPRPHSPDTPATLSNT
jgi:hypothetical protein